MTSPYQHFTSSQNAPHQALETLVAKYLRTRLQKPIAHHQHESFSQIIKFSKRFSSIIVDSCCGTGMSTRLLAEQFSESGVVGIDKSAARLARGAHVTPPNCLLVRGDVIDLWRMLLDAKIEIDRHYIFFPNPWPKAEQVKRRFHAHPIFSTMVALAPFLEVRTNWQVYAEELIIALKILKQNPELTIKNDDSYMTLFEKKYVATNCPIYIINNDSTDRACRSHAEISR